jgi:hypothetical protein
MGILTTSTLPRAVFAREPAHTLQSRMGSDHKLGPNASVRSGHAPIRARFRHSPERCGERCFQCLLMCSMQSLRRPLRKKINCLASYKSAPARSSAFGRRGACLADRSRGSALSSITIRHAAAQEARPIHACARSDHRRRVQRPTENPRLASAARDPVCRKQARRAR